MDEHRGRLVFVVLLVATTVSVAAKQAQRPAPQKLTSDVRAACDAAYAIAVKTPGASVRRRTGTFSDETLREPIFGCGLTISGSFARAGKGDEVAQRLRQGFSDHAWKEMPAYSADGMDGTSFAYRRGEVSCLVRATWNGGAAGEPSVPADDRYRIAVICTSPVIPEKRWR